MLGVMTGDAEACLLKGVKKEILETDASTRTQTIKVQGGILLAGGIPCPFEGATLEVHSNGSIFVCLKREFTDERTFEDGQKRPCGEVLTASLSVTDAGAEKAYRLDGLRTFMELLFENLSISEHPYGLEVMFLNGYKGYVNIRNTTHDDWEIIIDISSTEQEWDMETAGFKGMLFKVVDESLYLAESKKSPLFTYEGKKYYIAFSGGNGVCHLRPERDEDFDFDGSNLPLMPVRLSFKYSEMTNWY